MPRHKRQNTSRKNQCCNDKGESKSLPGNELEETGVDSSTNRDDDENVTTARHNKSPESGETSFLCKYCEFSTSDRSKCSEHSKQHKIHCHVCEFSSLSREQLAKHCKSQHGLCLDVSSTDRAFFMPCTFCSFVTFSRENLEKHTVQKHPGKQINHTVKKMTNQFDTQINKADKVVSKSSIELTGHLNIGVKANPIVIKDSAEEDNKVKLEIKCKTDAIGDIQNVSALEKDELLKQQLVPGIYSDMLTIQRQQLGNGAVDAKDETFTTKATSHFRSVHCLTCQYSSTSIINLKDHTFDQHPLSSAAGTFNPNGQSRDPQDTVFFCVDKNCIYSSSSFPLFQEHLIKCCACKDTFTAIEKERIRSTISYILEYGKKYNMKIKYDFFDLASSYLGPSFLENQTITSSVSVMNNQTIPQADAHSLQTHSAETSTQNPFLETNFSYASLYDTQNSSENVTSGVYHQSKSTQSSRLLSGCGTRNTQTLESSRVSAHRGANSQMEQSRLLTVSEGRKSSESGQSDLMQMCSILPIVDETDNHKGSCPNQLLNINSSSSLYGDLSNTRVAENLQLPLAKQSLSTQTNPHCSQMDQTRQLGSSFQPLPGRLLQGMLQTNLNHGHQSALLEAVQNFNQVPCCDPAAKAGSAFHACVNPGKPDSSSLGEGNPPFTSTASDIYQAPLVRFASVNSENMPYHNTNVNQGVTGSSNQYNMTTASASVLETLSQSVGLDFSSGSPTVMLPDKFGSVNKVQGLRNSDYIEPRRALSYPVPECQRSPVNTTTQGLALHSFSEVPQGYLIASSCQGSVLPLSFHQSMPAYSQTQTKTYQSPSVASQEYFHVHQVSRLPSSFLQDPVCSQTQMGFQQLPQGHPAVCQDGSDLPSSLYQGAPEYAQSQKRIDWPPEMAHQRHSTVPHQQMPSTSSSFHDGTQMKSQDQVMVQKSPSVLAAGNSAVSQNEYGLLLSYPQKAAVDYQTPLRVQQSNSVTPQGHSAVDCYGRSLSFHSETDVSFEVQGMVHQPPQMMPPVHSSVCSDELSLHTTVAKNYMNQHHRSQVSVPSNSHTGCHQTNMGNSLKADAAIQANQNPTTSNKTAQTFVLSEQSSYVQALPPRSFLAVKSPVAGVPLYNPPPSYFNACVYTAATGNVPLGLPESCTPGINVNAANPKTRASCQNLNTNPNCPAPPRSDKLNCTEPGVRRKESGLAVASLQGTCAPVPSRNFSQHVRRISFTQEKQCPKASRVLSLRSKRQPPGLAPKASGGDDDDVILTADTRLPPEQQQKFSQSFIRKPTGRVVKSAPRLKRLAALDSQSTSQNSSSRMLNGSGSSPKQLPKHFYAHDYFEYLACKAVPQINIDKSSVIIDVDDDDDDGGGMNTTVGKNSEKTGQGKVMITTKFSYSCFHCGKQLPRELLKQHMSSYHKDIIVGTLRDAETGDLKFLCPQLACNFMTNTTNRLRNHLLKCYSQDKSELPDFGTGIKSARSLKNKQDDVLSFRGSRDNPIDLEDRNTKDNFSCNLSDAFGLVINMSERREPSCRAQMCVSCQVVPPQRENKHGRLQKRMLHPTANTDSRGGYSAHSGDSQMVDRAARSRSAVTNHCRQNNEKQAGKSTGKVIRKSLQPSLTVPQYVQEIPSHLLDPVKHKAKPVSPFRQPKNAQRISSVIVLDADSSEQQEKGAQENVQNLPSQRAQKLMPIKSCPSSSEHIKAGPPENIQQCSQVASAGQNVPFSTASLLESSMKSSRIGSLGPDHSSHNLECSATSILLVGAQPNMPFNDKHDCVEEVKSAVVTEAPFTRLREVPVQQITTQLLAKLKKLTNNMDVNSITSSKITNSSQRAPDTSPPQSDGGSGSLPETGITDTDLVQFSQTSEKPAVPVLDSIDSAVKKVEGVCESSGAVSENVEQVGDLSSPIAVVNKQLTVASGAPCKELSRNLELAINSDKPVCSSSPARISTRKQKSIVRQNSHLLQKDHLKQEIEIVFPPLHASAHLKPVLVTLKTSEGNTGCPRKEVITTVIKQENMNECGKEYKSDNKSVKKGGVSGEQNADLGYEAREPGKYVEKHCAVFEKITEKKCGRDRTLKSKRLDVINQTTGQLLPKKRKMERRRKMCRGEEKDEATETIVEEYYVRRSSRKRKSVINNSCSDSDNFNELFQDFVDDDVDNYDSGDEYRVDSDDYGSDTDNEQKERPEKSRKMKRNKSKLPPDPTTFCTSTRGRFKCYFCQRVYRECLTVKAHVLKKHGGRLCAIDLDQCGKTEEERLLLFCPRECVYVTSSLEGFNTHVNICTKRMLETDMDKFSKQQSGRLKAAVHARKSGSMDLDKDRLKLSDASSLPQKQLQI